MTTGLRWRGARRWARRTPAAGAATPAFAALLVSTLLVTAPSTPPSAGSPSLGGAALAVATTMVSAGDDHSCALSSGRVKCWGDNSQGQLGIGSTSDQGDAAREMGADLLSVDLGTGRTAAQIVVGLDQSCALLDNATVKCWGDNGNGQLGQGDTFDRGNEPGEMGNTLFAVNLGTGRTATAISAGGTHTCALLDNGQVKCWGDNSQGQLGVGSTTALGNNANEMGDNLPAVDLGTGRTATQISGGFQHTCARLDNGTVKCWGDNSTAQLGLGDQNDRGDAAGEMGDNLPVVNLGTGRTALAVSAGWGHSCALLDNNSVKCWGNNTFGQLGLGDTSRRGDVPGEMGDSLPALNLGAGRTAVQIAAARSGSFTCAVLDDATAKCWGAAADGQLGLGNTLQRGDNPNEMGDQLPPIDLGTGRTATQVAAGANHACAALDDGTVKCWGDGEQGELGLGDTTTRGDNTGEMGDDLPVSALDGDGVEGTVTGGGGAVIPGALVAVLRGTDFSIAAGTEADGDGRFAVSAPAGSYLVYGIDRTGAHAPAFHGAPDTVAISGGQSSPADVGLVPLTGSVSGAVTDASTSNPVAGAYVMALDDATGAPEGGVQADGTGHYTLAGLRAGPHFLVFLDLAGGHEPRFYPSAPSLATAATVNVTGGGTTTADAALPAQTALAGGTAITGHVRDDALASLPGRAVVALRSSDLRFARGAVTNATGGYALSVPAGSYVVGALDPTGTHATEWFQGQPSSGFGLATPVASPATTDFELPAAVGSMSGVVTNDVGTPTQGAWVILVRPSGVAGAAVTAADGSFHVDDLPPDNYRVAVVAPASGTLVYWPDATSFAGGATVVVAAGQDSAVNTTLPVTNP